MKLASLALSLLIFFSSPIQAQDPSSDLVQGPETPPQEEMSEPANLEAKPAVPPEEPTPKEPNVAVDTQAMEDDTSAPSGVEMPRPSTKNSGKSALSVFILGALACLSLVLAIASFIIALTQGGRASRLAARLETIEKQHQQGTKTLADFRYKMETLEEDFARKLRVIGDDRRLAHESADHQSTYSPASTGVSPVADVSRVDDLNAGEITAVLEAVRDCGIPSISGSHMELRFCGLPVNIRNSASDDDSLRKIIPRINLAFSSSADPLLRRQNFLQILETRAPDGGASPYVISISKAAIEPCLQAMKSFPSTPLR